jgi:hypothetical protein
MDEERTEEREPPGPDDDVTVAPAPEPPIHAGQGQRHRPGVVSVATSIAQSAVDSVGSLASAAADSVGSAASAAAASAGTVASAAADSVGSVASAAAGSLGSVARSTLDEADHLATATRRRVAGKGPVGKRRGRATEPLPLLYDAHPEARRTAPREVGLEIVPIERIRGTAVEGSAQRGTDFRPLPVLRGKDWEARYQRILRAMDRLENLPPVDLVKFADDYWIVDGHNRVAAALEKGQMALDAEVVELRPRGSHTAARRIAPYLQESATLQAAGSGRRSRTAMSFESLEPDRLASERRALRDDVPEGPTDGPTAGSADAER